MRAIAYCRVSTEDQATGYSLDVQNEQITYEVSGRGWILHAVIYEKASAKNLKGRPLLVQALDDLKAKRADVLVVSRFDRLTRSVADFYSLMGRAEKEGWSILCLNPALDMTEPFGRAMAGMAAVFAQLERELNSMRQLESVQARKAAGTYSNGAVAGRTAMKPEVEHHVLDLRAQRFSIYEIADRMEGWPSATGKTTWSVGMVRKVLRRRGDPLGRVAPKPSPIGEP